MLRSDFYFVGNYHSASIQVFNYLKDHVIEVTKISHISELDQSDPTRKCVIIFSNPREALDFLSKGLLPKETFCALIMERDGVFKNEAALKTFEAFNLKFYTPKSVSKLIGDLDQFLLNIPTVEELQFNVQIELNED